MKHIPPNHHQPALPLHLTLAMLPLLISKIPSSSLNGVSCSLSRPLAGLVPNALHELQQSLHEIHENQKLAQAVETEAKKRASEFVHALNIYKTSPYHREVGEAQTVHTIGSARLLSFGYNEHAPVVLLIPSLINRYYILDLTKKLSFARFLAEQNLRVYVVDWGSPSHFEREFNCALYVTEILIPMLEHLRHTSSNSVTLGGYCMGGIFALAAASIRPDLVDKIAFFATPWDFSSAAFPRFELSKQDISQLRAYIYSSGNVSAEFIHTLFHWTNPYTFQSKLREFAVMQNTQSIQDFMAIEHWVNDGVAMTQKVAEDCLIHWTQDNQPFQLKWRVGGQVIDPAKITIPSFLVAPYHDTIVPSDCALPLADKLPDCHIVKPKTGHIGMMVGRERKSALWNNFAKWVIER